MVQVISFTSTAADNTISFDSSDNTFNSVSFEGQVSVGPKGDKGDTGAAGTTDYNQLENLPDLSLKSDVGHTHTATQITDFDTEVSNNTEVSANTAARHTHTNTAVLNATTASFTTADETKLDAIAPGATANATDAQLRDRATHTGAQAIGTVTGLQTALDGKQATGDYATNTSLTSHTSNTSNPHSVTKAQVGLSNVPNTDFTADVSANTAARHTHPNKATLDATDASFTTAKDTKLSGIATGATANATDAQLRDRSTHTGTQAQSTITNLTTDLAAKANASDTVNLTGNQTIVGVKTFSSSPVVPTATTGTQAVNKAQMDAADALKANLTGANFTGAITSTNFRTGTGFPNGVVTANVGTIYIDTAVTNGASSWIKKSGTGNTGWGVLEGDTGWRYMVSEWTSSGRIASISSAEKSGLRRVNNLVYVALPNFNLNDSSSQTLISSWPSGFKKTPAGPKFSSVYIGGGGSNMSQISGAINVHSLGLYIPPSSAGPGVILGAYADFFTDDPWPSTLPGTAA